MLESRPVLGSTQPPIQRVPGDLSTEVKRQGHETDYSPPSSVEVKNGVDLCLHCSILFSPIILFKVHIFLCSNKQIDLSPLVRWQALLLATNVKEMGNTWMLA
jgi:hypothetical protein